MTHSFEEDRWERHQETGRAPGNVSPAAPSLYVRLGRESEQPVGGAP